MRTVTGHPRRNRRSRRVMSIGTVTFRDGIPGGTFEFRDAFYAGRIVTLSFGWMLLYGPYR